MTEMSIVNLVLWSVQAFLALFFLAAGAPKLIGRGIERWTGFAELPRPQVVVIGFAEVLGALETGLWASIAAVVAIGRWDLIASVDVPPWVLAAALGLLVPAAIVNVIVLLRRPVRSDTPRPVSETGPVRSPQRLPT